MWDRFAGAQERMTQGVFYMHTKADRQESCFYHLTLCQSCFHWLSNLFVQNGPSFLHLLHQSKPLKGDFWQLITTVKSAASFLSLAPKPDLKHPAVPFFDFQTWYSLCSQTFKQSHKVGKTGPSIFPINFSTLLKHKSLIHLWSSVRSGWTEMLLLLDASLLFCLVLQFFSLWTEK